MLFLRSARVAFPDGLRPGTLVIHGGRIVAIDSQVEPPDEMHTLDVGTHVVMPGLVDTHVHVNEPGRTEWEGFATATRAAAAGGVTTIVDMPLNSIPATTTVAGLDAKRKAAEGHSFVDVGFWGGVVPGNVDELEPLARAGVRGFKCFMSPSGVDEFPACRGERLATGDAGAGATGTPAAGSCRGSGAVVRSARCRRGGATRSSPLHAPGCAAGRRRASGPRLLC